MDLGVTQQEAARQIGADQWTVINWEKGRTEPAVRFTPAILRFLGYDPFPPGTTLQQRLRSARRKLGLTQRALGSSLDLSEGTVYDAEHGRQRLTSRSVRRIARFLRVEQLHKPASLSK